MEDFQRLNHLPDDEYDEDDELDARIAKVERNKRRVVHRGSFFWSLKYVIIYPI